MEQENMMNREYFEEIPAENILDIRRKNREQYANDEVDDGTTNLILISRKRKYEQVTSPKSDLLLAGKLWPVAKLLRESISLVTPTFAAR